MGALRGSSGPAPHCCSGVSAVWGGGSWRPLGSFAALTEPRELSPHFKTSWVLFRLCVHLKVPVHVWLSLVSPQPSCGLTLSSPPSTQTPPTPAPAHPRRLPPPTAWEPDSLKRLGFVIFLHLTFKGVGPLVQQRFMEHLPW